MSMTDQADDMNQPSTMPVRANEKNIERRPRTKISIMQPKKL